MRVSFKVSNMVCCGHPSHNGNPRIMGIYILYIYISLVHAGNGLMTIPQYVKLC